MDWDQRYRDGNTPWDHGEAAPPLLEVLADWPEDLWGDGAVLVPGCGRGHDAAALGRAEHRVIGLDLSPTATAEGRERYGELGGLDFLTGSFLDPELPAKHSVSAIWEHTCFCALPLEQRPAYASAAARWLAPGGRFIGVFYLDPGEDDGPPFGVSRSEIEGLFAGSFSIERAVAPTRFFSSREGRELLVEMVRTS